MSETLPAIHPATLSTGFAAVPPLCLSELMKSLIRTGLKLNPSQALPPSRSPATLTEQAQYALELGSWLDLVADEQLKRLRQIEAHNHEQALQIMARSQESEIDSLTGLANRRAFDRKLSESCLSVQHSHCPLVLVILDIDHFKLINDTRGHHVGDAVLRGLSIRLRSNLPENSTLARIGGEEFVLLMAGATFEQAMEIADSIRSLVARTVFAFEGQRLAVTISCGVAQLRPLEHGEQALRRADCALYAAKQAGRNRTVGHDGTDTPESIVECLPQLDNSNTKAELYELDLNKANQLKSYESTANAQQPLAGLRTNHANWCDSVMFFWYLRQRLAECQRNNDNLCVMAMELDGASSLSRVFGVAAYHFMLRAEMLHLDSNFRDMDVLCRTCNSKVLAILPRAELASLEPLLDRLRSSMDRFVYPTLDSFVDYSISLGITQLQADDCVQSLVKRAELALATAQAHGPASFFACDTQRTWTISDREINRLPVS